MARAKYGQQYYDKYAVASAAPASDGKEESAAKAKTAEKVKSGKVVTITATSLTARIGDSTKYAIAGHVKKGEQYEWVATSPVTGWNAIRVLDQICWVSGYYSKVEAA